MNGNLGKLRDAKRRHTLVDPLVVPFTGETELITGMAN